MNQKIMKSMTEHVFVKHDLSPDHTTTCKHK